MLASTATTPDSGSVIDCQFGIARWQRCWLAKNNALRTDFGQFEFSPIRVQNETDIGRIWLVTECIDILWVIEMEIVSPPFVLDFAGAYLDHRPDYRCSLRRHLSHAKTVLPI